MILGEAIGLRAFVQFDLLRIYAPSPSSVGFREDNRTFIPYVNVYPSYINDHQTVNYCLEQIIADLKEAQRILEEVDKESKMNANSRFNINDTEKYKGKSLYVTREHAVKLKKDEYFIADLIDMQVELEDGTAFGVLTDVMQTGANDVYCIRTEEHGEVLIPAIKDCILDVDVEAGKMKIHLLDGLI